MKPYTEYHDISRWERHSIDSVPIETGSGCKTTSMKLNFKTKEFYYMTYNAGDDRSKNLCEKWGVQELAKPRIAQIIGGSEIISKEFAKIKKSAYHVLSSSFRAKVSKVAGE